MDIVEFENCKAEFKFNAVYIYSMDGRFLGTICGNNPEEDWELIKAGHNPINEKWEDGAGKTCTIEGWI